MQVAMIGCGFHDFEVLENVIKLFNQHFNVNRGFSYVLVCTCNRAELYFTSSDIKKSLIPIEENTPEEITKNLFFYSGENCFHHLALVTAGLESLIISETEIQGQIKKAYEKACSERNLDKELHYIFQKSLAIGKTMRSQFQLGKGLPDIEHLIFQFGIEYNKDFKDAHVLVVGATEFNEKIVKYLKIRGMRNLKICSRTAEHANKFAQSEEIEVYPWEKRNEWSSFNWIITAVKTQDDNFLFEKNMLSSWDEKKLIFDLGVPRNVDPQLENGNHLKIFDVKSLGEAVQKQRIICIDALEPVEIAVKEKVTYFCSKLAVAA